MHGSDTCSQQFLGTALHLKWQVPCQLLPSHLLPKHVVFCINLYVVSKYFCKIHWKSVRRKLKLKSYLIYNSNHWIIRRHIQNISLQSIKKFLNALSHFPLCRVAHMWPPQSYVLSCTAPGTVPVNQCGPSSVTRFVLGSWPWPTESAPWLGNLTYREKV